MKTGNTKWPKLPPMMKQLGKNGTVYVYTGQSVWDPVKKRPKVQNKTSCGKLFNDQVIFSRKFLEKHPELEGLDVRHDGKKYVIVGKRKASPETFQPQAATIYSVGATHLFEELARQTKLRDLLEQVFSEKADDILSCVYLMLLSPNSPWMHFDVLKKQFQLSSQLDFTHHDIARLVNEISKEESLCSQFLESWRENIKNNTLNTPSYAVSNENGSTLFFDALLNLISYEATPRLTNDFGGGVIPEVVRILEVGQVVEAEKVLYELFSKGQHVVRVSAKLDLLSPMRKQAHRLLWFAQERNRIKTGLFQSWSFYTQEVSISPGKGKKGAQKVFAHMFVNRNSLDAEKRKLMYQLQQIVDKKTQLAIPQKQMDLFMQSQVLQEVTPEENFLLDRYMTQKADQSYVFLEEQIMDDVLSRCATVILSSMLENPAQILQLDALREFVLQTDQSQYATCPLSDGTIDNKGWLFLQTIALILLVEIQKRIKANTVKMRASDFSIKRMIDVLNGVYTLRFGRQVSLTQLTREQTFYYRLMDVRLPVA